MNVVKEQQNDLIILNLEGRFDANTKNVVEDAIREAQAEKGSKVIADLGKMSYISSIGLRIFLLSAKGAEADGGRFALCSPSSNVLLTLEIAGFIKILEIYKSRSEAEESFARK